MSNPRFRCLCAVVISTLLSAVCGCAPSRIMNRVNERAMLAEMPLPPAPHTTNNNKNVPAADMPVDRPTFRSRRGSVSDVAQVGHEEPINSPSPAVSGKRLGILPGSSATERALELMGQLEAANVAYQELQAQLEDQKQVIEQKNRRLAEALEEVKAANQELRDVQRRLGTWQGELKDLHEKIRTSEAENLSNMQAILTLLKQLIDMGPEDVRGGGVKATPLPSPSGLPKN